MTYKNFAINVAKKAGAIMRKNFVTGMKKEWKSDSSPVTETDIKINRLVIEQVKKHYKGHDVLGEEESFRQNHGKYLWVCDPVDGTTPFSHGIPTCVFSLALVKDGQAILGVIYDPFMDRMFFAELGKGAFLNHKKIKVNNLDLSRGVTGWSNIGMTELREKFPRLASVCLWCICYEGALVASGQLQATYYNHNKAHDIAALKVIVEEAGGKVTDKFGKDQRYDGDIKGALITNGKVHKELLKFLGDLRKKGKKL